MWVHWGWQLCSRLPSFSSQWPWRLWVKCCHYSFWPNSPTVEDAIKCQAWELCWSLGSTFISSWLTREARVWDFKLVLIRGKKLPEGAHQSITLYIRNLWHPSSGLRHGPKSPDEPKEPWLTFTQPSHLAECSEDWEPRLGWRWNSTNP
jgi:hypothetical protein